ncbi:uncharacterized protein LAESUDRAFT_747763 [Laetiporus sulphureus 93-53]|uniref:Uncharacterized protein n=1 Tax=Laetiporus sulphureus 93-53 TaxID=1314785 RepID=A0A165GJ11_9APHY|nr:uncharacterized protein LAESUDRAFT_747763 [Laetiporus sulphureus 93-53]KZT10417.1 hypothetical protein LAESUDRAFT_747763 [Laetiporus sulphureus 93-53]
MPRTRGVVRDAPPPAVDKSPARPAAMKRSVSLTLPPTPPRTATKRKRARSRVTDSESDEEDELPQPAPRHDSDEECAQKRPGAVVIGNKKRKTLDAIAEELSETQVEEAFWMGTSTDARRETSKKEGKEDDEVEEKPKARYELRSRSQSRSPSSSPPIAPHLLQRQRTGLFSPPPSRRQPRMRARSRQPSPPARASRSPPERPLFPVRDSPNNPFLSDESPTPAAEAESGPESLPEPTISDSLLERPTITYVFRGTKVILANPHYKPPGSHSDSEGVDPSSLPVTHPDFSPPPAYGPKLLFPEARRDLLRRRAQRGTQPQPSARPTTRASSRRTASATPEPSTPQRRSRTKSRSPVPPAVASDDEDSELVLPARPQAKAKAKAPRVAVAEEDIESALQAAMASRLAHHVGALVPEDTKTRTRAHGAPRLPEKDNDAMRRAMGPVRVASRPAAESSR